MSCNKRNKRKKKKKTPLDSRLYFVTFFFSISTRCSPIFRCIAPRLCFPIFGSLLYLLFFFLLWMVGNISSHHRLKRSLSLASDHVASVYFSSSLSYRRRFRTRERRRQNIHFTAASPPAWQGMSKMTAAATTISKASKFFFFLTHIFSELKSARFCGRPLGTHEPPSKRFLGKIPHLSNEFTLDHITRNYLHITD